MLAHLFFIYLINPPPHLIFFPTPTISAETHTKNQYSNIFDSMIDSLYDCNV